MKTAKNIDKFTKYILDEVQTESPSNNFVDNVMTSVRLENKGSSLEIYNPLISKPVWVLIAAVFAVSIVFILTGFSQNSTIFSKFSNINFTFLDNTPSINIFESIHFSNTFTYSFMFFTVLVLIQLFVMNNYFNRKETL